MEEGLRKDLEKLQLKDSTPSRIPLVRCCVCDKVTRYQESVCESCLQSLVERGISTHPLTGQLLPICKCGKYFGTECRQLGVTNCNTKVMPKWTDDPKENRRLLAKALSIPCQHGMHGRAI